jgi:iron complex outermembrane receptor protein
LGGGMAKTHFYLSVAAGILSAGPVASFVHAEPTTPAAQTGSAAAGGEDETSGLAEIVVTAQRREQKLQDVPISITAETGAELAKQNITGVDDLAKIDSSALVTVGTGSVVTFLRGMGNTSVSPGNESSVAYYVDGVYYPRIPVSFLEFNAIERVEVLSGPQGTLFGRNSSSGLVQIITRDPTFGPSLYAEVGYGNYQTTKGQIYASDGFGSNVAGDIAVVVNQQKEGWGRDLTTGEKLGYQNYAAARSKWLVKFDDNTELRLTGEYHGSNLDIGVPTNHYEGTIAGAEAFVAPPQKFYPAPFYDTIAGTSPYVQERGWDTSAKLTHDFSFMKFSSLTDYQHLDTFEVLSADFIPLNYSYATFPLDIKQVTQEFQLQSEADSLFDWVTGLFYLDNETGVAPFLLEGQQFAVALHTTGGYEASYAQQVSRSYAGFAQATFHIFTTSNLTLGARYSHDELHGYGTEVAALPPDTVKTLVSNDSRATFNKPTYRAIFDHHFTEGLMSYVSYNRGYKAGTYALQPISAAPTLPEVDDAYEVGAKSLLFDNRLRINGALFYNNLTNAQVRRYIGSSVSFVNAPKAKSEGVDISIDGQITKTLTARVGATFLHAIFVEFPGAPGTVPNPNPPYGSTQFMPINASGNDLPHSPHTTITSGFDYTVPTSIGTWDLNVGDYYNSGFYWDPDLQVRQNAYNTLDAQLRLIFPKNWKLSLWGKNITGTKYYTYEAENAGPPGHASAAAAPATYGVGASYAY